MLYLTDHCRQRIAERLNLTDPTRQEQLVRDIERYGWRKGDRVIFGNVFIPVDGSTAITFIRRKR